MKRIPLSCTPVRNSLYRVAAVLFSAGVVLQLVFKLKYLLPDLKEAFLLNQGWKFMDAASALILCLTLLGAAAMLYLRGEYRLHFSAFVLALGLAVQDGPAAASTRVAMLFLLSAVGGVWNKPLFKRVPAPWPCLLAAAISLVFFVGTLLSGGGAFKEWMLVDTLGTLLIWAALFMLTAFTQPVRRNPISDIEVLRAVRRPRNAVFFFAGMLLLCSAAFSIYGNASMAEYFDGVKTVAAYVFQLIAIFLLASRKPRNRYGLALVLLFLAFRSSAAATNVPTVLFFLLFISAFGFRGNRSVLKREGASLTAIDALIVFGLALCLVCEILDLTLTVRGLLEAQPHKVTKAYRAETVKAVLVGFAPILNMAALLLCAVFTKTEKAETKIVSIAEKFIDRTTGFCKNFQNGCGGKIKKLAYVFSCIYVILAEISGGLAVLAVILWVVSKVTTLLPSGAGVPIVAVPILIGIAIACLFSAMVTWYVYAYGQITEDVHVKGLFRGGHSYTKVNAAAADDDLPDF